MIAGPLLGTRISDMTQVNNVNRPSSNSVDTASVLSIGNSPEKKVNDEPPVNTTLSPAQLKKTKRSKKKSAEKMKPTLSRKFDELNLFDVYDFIQFKTQMKIVKFRADHDDSFWDGPVIVPKAKTPKKKAKESTSKQKPAASKPAPKLPPFKRKFSDEVIRNFMKANPDVRSVKKARAMIKTNEVITKFLEKHPEIPVEKSHKKLQAEVKEEVVEVSKVKQEKDDAPVIPKKKPKSTVVSVPPKSQSKSVTDVKASSEKEKVEPTSSKEKKPTFSPPKSNPARVLKQASGKTEKESNSRQEPPRANTQQVDHVTAINNWIQKNYHNLTNPQKQLVHMQLQYLNNLKKTSFQNSTFILSPQHLNNLNNLTFLSANYNPYNRSYANFVNVPSYAVDVNQVNQLNLQLIQALQQQQQQQRLQVQQSFGASTAGGNNLGQQQQASTQQTSSSAPNGAESGDNNQSSQ